jgi:hypothetical protein
MSVLALHSVIRMHVADNFGNEYPVVYDNAPIPSAVTGNSSQPWIRAAIRTTTTEQTAMGGSGPDSHRYRIRGTLLLALFDASEKGDGVLLELADRIVNTFRSVTVQNVVFRTPNVTTVGRIGGSWQVNVSCPFYSDEVGA